MILDDFHLSYLPRFSPIPKLFKLNDTLYLNPGVFGTSKVRSLDFIGLNFASLIPDLKFEHPFNLGRLSSTVV